jgi:hypothetical protein
MLWHPPSFLQSTLEPPPDSPPRTIDISLTTDSSTVLQTIDHQASEEWGNFTLTACASVRLIDHASHVNSKLTHFQHLPQVGKPARP